MLESDIVTLMPDDLICVNGYPKQFGFEYKTMTENYVLGKLKYLLIA